MKYMTFITFTLLLHLYTCVSARCMDFGIPCPTRPTTRRPSPTPKLRTPKSWSDNPYIIAGIAALVVVVCLSSVTRVIYLYCDPKRKQAILRTAIHTSPHLLHRYLYCKKCREGFYDISPFGEKCTFHMEI